MKDPKDNIKNYQLFTIKHLCPTNSRGTRIKITDTRFQESKTIGYNYAFNTSLSGAVDWLTSNTEIKIAGRGVIGDEYFVIIKPIDHSFKSLKTWILEGKADK